MHISDLLGHYNGAASQAKPLISNKGVEKLTSTIEGLSKGNIFEGTVSSVKGGKVTLALSNGQTISARLDGKVSLQEGQSMFFQVKSNNGTQVEIKPYTAEGSGNPTILQALKMANLPTETGLISMVNKMMEEQMPIDKASLTVMARVLQENQGINVETLVQLQKLGLPVNEETAAQFENYLNDKQAISVRMDELISELPMAMADESLDEAQLKMLGQEIITIISEGLDSMPEGSSAIMFEQLVTDDTFVNTYDEGAGISIDAVLDNDSNEIAQSAQGNQSVQEEQLMQDGQLALDELAAEREADLQATGNSVNAEKNAVPNTLGSVLSEAQIQNFNEELKGIFPDVVIKESTSTVSILNEISSMLSDNPDISKESIINLFRGDGFKAVLKDAMEQQWMIKPESVSSGEKIEDFYEKVKTQIDKIDHAVRASGAEGANISQIANDIKSNVEFMNQINEAYTYVQIPLKMSGQNASGELYVYTNKKSLGDSSEDLSAFLHLDMDNLGSTDVSVKMHLKDISTNFYLEDDVAYNLVMEFLPQLDEKLKLKGYNSNSKVIKEENHINFVEDFLKKDQPSTGMVHRYSFDMRA